MTKLKSFGNSNNELDLNGILNDSIDDVINLKDYEITESNNLIKNSIKSNDINFMK